MLAPPGCWLAFSSTLAQELVKQEMEIDRRHDEQLLALQQETRGMTGRMG